MMISRVSFRFLRSLVALLNKEQGRYIYRVERAEDCPGQVWVCRSRKEGGYEYNLISNKTAKKLLEFDLAAVKKGESI